MPKMKEHRRYCTKPLKPESEMYKGKIGDDPTASIAILNKRLNEILDGGPKNLAVTPAYGRNYKTIEAALADWNAGKDFRQTDFPGTYLSNRDVSLLKSENYMVVTFYDYQSGRLGSVRL